MGHRTTLQQVAVIAQLNQCLPTAATLRFVLNVQLVSSIRIAITYSERNSLLFQVDGIIQRRFLYAVSPPNGNLYIFSVIGKRRAMVAINFTCRGYRPIIIEHFITPKVKTINSIPLYIAALLQSLEHCLQVFTRLIIGGDSSRIVVPRSAGFHFRQPDGTARIIPDCPTLVGHILGIVISISTINIPIGVCHSKVTT